MAPTTFLLFFYYIAKFIYLYHLVRLWSSNLSIYQSFQIKWNKSGEELIHNIRKMVKSSVNLTEPILNINDNDRKL